MYTWMPYIGYKMNYYSLRSIMFISFGIREETKKLLKKIKDCTFVLIERREKLLKKQKVVIWH